MGRVGIGLGVLSFAFSTVSPVLGQPAPIADQASNSAAGLYRDACAMCHGEELDDGEFGPPLKGAAFHQRWSGKTVGEIYDYLRTSMPPASPGSLPEDSYWLLLKLIFKSNDISIDGVNTDLSALKSIKIGN